MNSLNLSERIRFLKIIQPLLQKHRKPLLWIIIVRIGIILLTFLPPYLLKLLVDDVMVEKDVDLLPWIIFTYIGIYIAQTLLLGIQQVISNKSYNKLLFALRLNLWRKYIMMPFGVYARFNTGDLKNRIDADTTTFQNFVDKQLIDYLVTWLNVLILGGVLAYLNWKLSVVGFLMIPLSFIIARWIGTREKNAVNSFRSIWGEYEGWLFNCIQSWKEIKTLQISKRQNQMFVNYWHRLSKPFFNRYMFWYASYTFQSFKDIFINKMNMYFVGGILIFNNELSIGTLLVFMKYYELFFNGINTINDKDIQLNSDLPAMERVQEISRITWPTSPLPVGRIPNGEIEFNRVSFKYQPTQEMVLENISFKIKACERIAIVGRSGSGKSTLLKLLLGLLVPEKGEITLSGMELSDIKREALYQKIGVVMQDSILFNMTVVDNLLLAKSNATMDEIKNVCRMAYIDTFIEGLPQGYQTLIGERGVKLSGGQRQRLLIARALLRNPEIIIFDEATSALDHLSEKMIHQALDEIASHKTMIVVAHRLTSILAADRILVLDQGSIVGAGHHSQLLGRNPVYDQLFREQAQGQLIS